MENAKLAEFSNIGRYRFVYKDDTDEDIVCVVDAGCDADAIALARQAQHGLALEIWSDRKCLERLDRPTRFELWPA